jgi:hypothetical protein
LSENEAEKGSAWKIDNNKILSLAQGNNSDNAYTLDNVFGSEWTTRAVYDRTTEDIIKKVGFRAAYNLQVPSYRRDLSAPLENIIL